MFFFFFSSRRRHTRLTCDWSSDVCSSDLGSVARSRRRQRATEPAHRTTASRRRSEERREGKSVDLGGRRIIKKKNEKRGSRKGVQLRALRSLGKLEGLWCSQ